MQAKKLNIRPLRDRLPSYVKRALEEEAKTSGGHKTSNPRSGE